MAMLHTIMAVTVRPGLGLVAIATRTNTTLRGLTFRKQAVTDTVSIFTVSLVAMM